MNTMRILTTAAFVTAALVTVASAQQAQQAQRVRGMIEKVDGNTLL